MQVIGLFNNSSKELTTSPLGQFNTILVKIKCSHHLKALTAPRMKV